MPEYKAVFIAFDGLKETVIEPLYRLAATTRDEAEDEALALPPPEEANFVKLVRDGQYERPMLGFAL